MPAGRPTKLTKDLIDTIVEMVKNCAYVETACASVGIDKQTLYTWLREAADLRVKIAKDKKATPKPGTRLALVLTFSDAVKSAKAEAENSSVLIIASAAQWQARAWLLERQRPELYALKVDINAAPRDPAEAARELFDLLPHIKDVKSPEELQERLAGLESDKPGRPWDR
jgi:hypothetical protein